MTSARAYKFLFTGLVVAMMGCSDRPGPTEPVSSGESGVASQTGAASQYVNVNGPEAIYSSTSSGYTFSAGSNLIEPTYTWYKRYCDTLDVDSCASAWIYSGGASVGTGMGDYKTFSLVRDCSGTGTRSFQVKVDAKGWYSVTYSDTHVTALCPPDIDP